MLQTTTTKRPPSLTLSGARIFKQRLATIRKHCIGSQEPGARVQWTKFSWKYDFPTFSEISLLLLYANKNFRIPNLLATLFRPWLKMSPFRFKLGDRSRFAFVFRKEIFFSILVARQITAKWSRILVQTSSKRQIKRETRPDWLATRIPFFFFVIRVFPPPPRGSGQIAYKRPTLLELDLTVINTEFFSQTTASICLTLFPHSLKRYFNCNTLTLPR